MPEVLIRGIKVSFPFEPYDVQKAYMAKVIECLQNGTNGLLESPTGTGKTLSLLCSTLAWLSQRKAEVQAMEVEQANNLSHNLSPEEKDIDMFDMPRGLSRTETKIRANINLPKIIYASRTHSQLTQAMQELKRSHYGYVKAAVIGSRDQLCIHPEVVKEINNSNKIHLCKLKVLTRTCSYYMRVEKQKENVEFRQTNILDIEDLVRIGQKLKACPYFVSKDIVDMAEIIFMPYNYLLDPKTRKANNIELNNAIIILDEAHNVEKMCEESASIQIKSSDIATSIDDVTNVMKKLQEDIEFGIDLDDKSPKDFTLDDLALLKEILLSLEKAIDDIVIDNSNEGTTFPGSYIFDLLQSGNIIQENSTILMSLLGNLIQYFTVISDKNAFSRKGAGLQKLEDLLLLVFAGNDENYKTRIAQCFRVHVEYEEPKTLKTSTRTNDNWLSSKTTTKTNAKIVSYWCFSPGFGMQQLLGQNVRSIILTSGTLAPMKPLIAELGLPIDVQLENPHIVSNNQVCVKIVTHGPDKEPLISNFQNRNNQNYISSLGRTILSFTPVIPHGLLVFFPSYPLMTMCQESWQENGIWAQITRIKPIYVEPRTKEAFVNTMTEYYAKVNEPGTRGAIFMAVCRGKVSEGLDFADMNGRGVIVTGLPFPPLKDPRVILKKKYLELNRTRQNQMLTGNDWYVLEASRAVNQAIGRVIRHRHDYGAILLCDSRFNNPRQKEQLSTWIQGHLKATQQSQSFGPLIGEVSRFFRNAERTLPQPSLKSLSEYNNEFGSPTKMPNTQNTKSIPSHNRLLTSTQLKTEIVDLTENSPRKVTINDYKNVPITSTTTSKDFLGRLSDNVTAIDFNDMSKFNSPTSQQSLVTIHKRGNNDSTSFVSSATKKCKYKLVANQTVESSTSTSTSTLMSTTSTSWEGTKIVDENKTVPEERTELIKLVKSKIDRNAYKNFLFALTNYQKDNEFEILFASLLGIFGNPDLHYILRGMRRFIKDVHKVKFEENIGIYL